MLLASGCSVGQAGPVAFSSHPVRLLTCQRARAVIAAAAAVASIAPTSQQPKSSVPAFNPAQGAHAQQDTAAISSSALIASQQFLAAVAGAAAVAAAGAELQTDALPVYYHPNNANISITAPAVPPFKDSSSSAVLQLTPHESRKLTAQIVTCDCWEDVLDLQDRYGPQLNIIHVSAMLSKLGKLLRDSAEGLTVPNAQQLQQLMQQLEQTSILLMASAQLQQPVTRAVLRSVGKQLLVQDASNTAHQQPPIQPQQLSTIAWGFATAGYQPTSSWWNTYFRCSTPLLATYSSQELATAIWAAAKLQQHPPTAWLDGFLHASATALAAGSSRPQEVCMMLWGLVQLNAGVSSSWWGCLRGAVLGQLQGMKPRDIGQVLWAQARLQALPPKPWLSQVIATATTAARAQQLHRYSGRDVAMLLWALAALQQQEQQQQQRAIGDMQPQQQLLGMQDSQQQQQKQQLMEQLLRSLQMSNCKLAACVAQDYAHILWSVAILTQRSQQQQQQQERFLTASSSRSDHNVPHQLYTKMTPSRTRCTTSSWETRHSKGSPECSSSLGSLSVSNKSSSSSASQALLLSWSCLTWHYTQPINSGLGPTDAAQLLWAASQLGRPHWPHEAWMQQFWHISRQQMSCYNTQALTVAMWAAYKMGYKPPGPWLMAAVPILQQQLAELQPAAACQLLYVLAKLEHRPNPDFMQQLLSRMQLDSHRMQPRAFACVLWSLGRLGYQPGHTWLTVMLHHLSNRVQKLGMRELQNVVWGLLELRTRLPQGLVEKLQQRMLEVQQQQ